MSDRDDSNATDDFSNIQNAYDLTYDLYCMAENGRRKAGLLEVFGFAAMGACIFLPVPPLVGVAAIGMAYIKSAEMRRNNSLCMASHFNEVASNLGAHARSYLQDLERDLRDVSDFSWDDINPIKQYERKNYGGLGLMAACVVLMMPTFLPIALSMTATYSDRERVRAVKSKAYEAGNKLNEDYGDQLTKPLGP